MKKKYIIFNIIQNISVKYITILKEMIGKPVEKIIKGITKKVLINRGRRKVFFILIMLISITIIFFRGYTLSIKYSGKYLENNKKSKSYVKVISKEKVTEKYVRYLVKLEDNKKTKYVDKFLLNIYVNNYDESMNEIEKQVFLESMNNFKYGDILEVSGKILIPETLKNTGEFNYRRYLNSNMIYGSISSSLVKKVKNEGNSFLKIVYNFKDSVSYRIENLLNKKEANLFKSMLYGDDIYLDETISNDLKKIGISHLTAVSGSNVYIVIYTVSYICSILKFSKRKRIVFSTLLLFIFILFTSSEASILRASIMAYIGILLEIVNLKLNKYLVLILAAIILLIYNPLYIFNAGFLLSFISVLSIMLYSNSIFSFFDSKFLKISKVKKYIKKGFKYILYNVFKYINTYLSVTISSLILTFPIYIYFFNKLELSLFISNVLIVSISSVFLTIAAILIPVIFVPFLSNILTYSCAFFLKLIIFLSSYISSLNLLSISFKTPSIYLIVSYYLIIFLLHLLFKFRKKLNRYVMNIKLFNKWITLSKKRIIEYISKLIAIASTFVIFCYIYTSYFENYVIFFNIKQGNMCYIRYKGKNVLVDMGSDSSGLAKNTLENFLKNMNIHKIDYIFLTHMHSDHINGIFDLPKDIEIKSIAMNVTKNYVNTYGEVIDSIDKIAKDRGISIVDLEENDKIKIYDDFIFVNILPIYQKVIYSSDLENTNSNVFFVKVKNMSMLFLGDSTKETESLLVDKILNENISYLKNIDILQVPHHGSKTSTSKKLLENISFKEGVISAFKKRHGHPDEGTIKSLKEYNIKIRNTEKEGQILYKIY